MDNSMKIYLRVFLLVCLIICCQSEGGLFSKLMMMMMKNRRRQFVPFPVPFNPLGYSGLNPLNFQSLLGVPIGGYSSFGRSGLVGGLNGLNTIEPLTGLNFNMGALPLLSGMRSGQKLLSRSSAIYEPTVASSNLLPQYAPNLPPNNLVITSPTAIGNGLANPTLNTLNNPLLLQQSFSNNATNGNILTEKSMNGPQGELIKQELKEHYLNNMKIQYLKNLREHLIKDQQIKEQYLKELSKKSLLPFPFMEMYEEV